MTTESDEEATELPKLDIVAVEGGYNVVYGIVDTPVLTACHEQLIPSHGPWPECGALIKKAREDIKRIDPKELIKRLPKDEYTEGDYPIALQREVAQEVHPRLRGMYYVLKEYGTPCTDKCPLIKAGLTVTVCIRVYTREFNAYVYVLCTNISMPWNNFGADFRGLIDE
jgi:hypothetical protein